MLTRSASEGTTWRLSEEGENLADIRPTVLLPAVTVLLLFVETAVRKEPPMELARDQRALLTVTIGTGVSPSTKAAAAELAEYLGRMSGAEFKTAVGDGSRGIVLGCPADFARLPFAVRFGGGPFDARIRAPFAPARPVPAGATDMAVSMPRGTCSIGWVTGSSSPARHGRSSPA